MIKIRLRFAKNGGLRFIGHLDFLRVFQQTMRRAQVPAAYSQGFNPHLLVSFALPLPLGMASVHDYVDIQLTEKMQLDALIQAINTHAPDGLTITGAVPVESGPNAASLAMAADYALDPPPSADAVAALLGAQTYVVTKKTKSGLANVDIRPDIFDLWADGPVHMRLAAGSQRFLSPSLVAGLLCEDAAITRVQLYKSDGNGGLDSL